MFLHVIDSSHLAWVTLCLLFRSTSHSAWQSVSISICDSYVRWSNSSKANSVQQTLGGRARIVLRSQMSASSRRLLGATPLSASLSGPQSQTLAIGPLQTLSCCHPSLP